MLIILIFFYYFKGCEPYWGNLLGYFVAFLFFHFFAMNVKIVPCCIFVQVHITVNTGATLCTFCK